MVLMGMTEECAVVDDVLVIVSSSFTYDDRGT